MKKLLTISILATMIILMAVTGVNATTNSTLASELYSKLAKYGMTTSDKVKAERYLSDYPVTEAEANQLIAKADEAIKIMDEAGVTSYADLTAAQKAQIKSIANSAADIVGVTLTFDGSKVYVYKDGKLIDVIGQQNGKLVYTGNNNIVLVVSSIAIIALASVVVARKKLANA